MSKVSCVVLLSLILFVFRIPTFTQGNARWSTVVAQLLDYPAPPPPMLKVVADAMMAQEKRAKWREEHPDAEPGDDATAAELIAYWDQQIRKESGKQPSEQTRWRLLESYLDAPESYSRVFQLFPDTPQTHERIKQFLDQSEPQNLSSWESFKRKDAQERLRAWLMQHSHYFRDDLLQAVREVKLDGHTLVGEESLAALARLDWKNAQPILENYRKHPETAVSTLALRLLYLHAVEANDVQQTEALRQQLQQVVINPQATDVAREMAYETVMELDWTGQPEWFSSLMTQEKLLSMPQPITDKGDRPRIKSPSKEQLLRAHILSAPIRKDWEKWLPTVRALVTSSNSAAHNNAAICLVDVVFRQPNREAALTLLPWLTNPQWAITDDDFDRLYAIEAMGKVQLPEAIPGLLFILQNETGQARKHAIKALSSYRDPNLIARVLPVVQALVHKQSKDKDLSALVGLLLDLGGLEVKEKVNALEAYAAITEIDGDELGGNQRLSMRETKSLPEEIGRTLIEKQRYGGSFASIELAASIVERWRVLRKENPALAAKLWVIVSDWNYPVIDMAMAEQIADGSATLNVLLVAINQRQRLTANAGATLQPMLRHRGAASGIAAVLLNDEAKVNELLQGQDREAQVALLACARFARHPLPVPLVGVLLEQKEPLLKLAAERYLESEDSPAARKLILAKHKDEALILGAYEGFTPKPEYMEEWTEWENNLREDVRQGRAEEVIGEFEHHWSDSGAKHPYQNVEIRIRGEQATVCQSKDKARVECRSLAADELSALRALFDEVNFDELTPLCVPGNGFVGMAQEFVWFNKNGGRRVFARNLFDLRAGPRSYGLKERTPHERLDAFFDKLKQSGTYELRYALKDKIKDLQVISAKDDQPVTHVCAQDGEMRALVKDEKAKFSDPPRWLRVTDGKLGMETDQPTTCQIVDNREDMPEPGYRSVGYESPLWLIKTKDGVVREMTWNDEAGIYLCQAGRDPKLLFKGFGYGKIVTPDGRWLLMMRRKQSEEDRPIRIDLKTNAVTEINAEDVGIPQTIDPVSGRIVFAQWGSKEYKLYTPATGNLEKGTGEVEPLLQQRERPLQRIAGSKHEFWAAISDDENKKTKVGRYDAHNFKFTSLLELPDIQFTSMQMWVDEAKRQLYIAYKGHLLSLPFQP